MEEEEGRTSSGGEIYGRWAVWVLGQKSPVGSLFTQNSPKTLKDFIPTTKLS